MPVLRDSTSDYPQRPAWLEKINLLEEAHIEIMSTTIGDGAGAGAGKSALSVDERCEFPYEMIVGRLLVKHLALFIAFWELSRFAIHGLTQ